MSSKGAFAAPIEFFFWNPQKTAEHAMAQDLVSFYDENGQLQERLLPRGMVEKVLAIFDGGPKSVARRSGGLVVAEPYQLVIYDSASESEGIEAKVRVRVRFRDFRRDSQNQIVSTETIVHNKLVHPSELETCLPYRSDDLQRFVLDFGQGIVPIHVFQYQVDETGRTHCLFVEEDALPKVFEIKSAERQSIPIYWAEKEVLRFASDKPGYNGLSEVDLAAVNYRHLKNLGAPILPECLFTGVNAGIFSARSPADFRQQLRSYWESEPKAQQPPLKAMSGVETNLLLPSDVYEKN